MTLTEKQLREIRAAAAAEVFDKPYLRRGQAYYNKLYEMFPEIAEEINGGKFDMFYVDEKIQLFEKEYKNG